MSDGPGEIDAVRREALAALPAAMRAALEHYHRFTADPPPEDAKGFAAWQGAAKAALAHVEGVAKLLRWAEGQGDAVDGGIDHLLAEARAALGRLPDDG